MKLSQFKALSFDCYGTLIDWEAGLSEALGPLTEASGIGREELLERYGAVEHRLEEEHPGMRYSELLAKLYEQLAQGLGIEAETQAAAEFGASVGNWPVFPDSPEALQYLKRHFRLIILSNVDAVSFVGSNRQLDVQFDHVFTAEEIGSYKPSLRNFEYMLDRLEGEGIGKGELLHVAQSLYHDHVPANQLGLASAWIDRRAGRGGGGATLLPESRPHYDFRFTSLADLAATHKAEQGG